MRTVFADVEQMPTYRIGTESVILRPQAPATTVGRHDTRSAAPYALFSGRSGGPKVAPSLLRNAGPSPETFA